MFTYPKAVTQPMTNGASEILIRAQQRREFDGSERAKSSKDYENVKLQETIIVRLRNINAGTEVLGNLAERYLWFCLRGMAL